MGHTRIGFITGEPRVVSAQQRLQGYKDALIEAHIPFDPKLVEEGNWLHPSGYARAKVLLQLNVPPAAIVASNDLMAFGAIQAASEAGLEVGKHLSITGMDDIKIAATIAPALTTVRQPVAQLGEVAAEMLLQVMQGEIPSPLHRQLDTELIVRQSTGPVWRGP